MVRDWDLLRAQLLAVESGVNILADFPVPPLGTPGEQDPSQLEEFHKAENKFYGHLKLLMDAGYTDGVFVSQGVDGFFSYGESNPRLTMRGHDFLEDIRTPKVWEYVKSEATKNAVELSFRHISHLASIGKALFFGQ